MPAPSDYRWSIMPHSDDAERKRGARRRASSTKTAHANAPLADTPARAWRATRTPRTNRYKRVPTRDQRARSARPSIRISPVVKSQSAHLRLAPWHWRPAHPSGDGARRDISTDTRQGRSVPRAPLLVDRGVDLFGGASRIVRQRVLLEPRQDGPGAAFA